MSRLSQSSHTMLLTIGSCRSKAHIRGMIQSCHVPVAVTHVNNVNNNGEKSIAALAEAVKMR